MLTLLRSLQVILLFVICFICFLYFYFLLFCFLFPCPDVNAIELNLFEATEFLCRKIITLFV
jgi:hypothetical protein